MSDEADKVDGKNETWWGSLWQRISQKHQARSGEESLREVLEDLFEETASGTGNAPTAEGMLLSNILKLRERTVGDCMVPRADIVAMDVDADFKELVECMAEHAHSRVPAYRGTLDETVGMVHMKDVLPSLVKGGAARIADLLRPVLFIAPSMMASKLLLQMRQTRQHMAMVVDEFGGVDGLVTIEDLVEEVVGEIEDEHDEPAEPNMIARSDGTLLLDGRLSIDVFEEKVGQILTPEERETIDTLGGYVLHLAGHVPRIGEIVYGPDRLMFEVLATDQNRIKRIRARGARRQETGEDPRTPA